MYDDRFYRRLDEHFDGSDETRRDTHDAPPRVFEDDVANAWSALIGVLTWISERPWALVTLCVITLFAVGQLWPTP